MCHRLLFALRCAWSSPPLFPTKIQAKGKGLVGRPAAGGEGGRVFTWVTVGHTAGNIAGNSIASCRVGGDFKKCTLLGRASQGADGVGKCRGEHCRGGSGSESKAEWQTCIRIALHTTRHAIHRLIDHKTEKLAPILLTAPTPTLATTPSIMTTTLLNAGAASGPRTGWQQGMATLTKKIQSWEWADLIGDIVEEERGEGPRAPPCSALKPPDLFKRPDSPRNDIMPFCEQKSMYNPSPPCSALRSPGE